MASTPVTPESAVWAALLAFRAETGSNEITQSKGAIRDRIPPRDRPSENALDRAVEALVAQGRLKVEQRGGSKQPKTLIMLDSGLPLVGVQTSLPGTILDPFAGVRAEVEKVQAVQQERLDQHAAWELEIDKHKQEIARLEAAQAELMEQVNLDNERLTQILLILEPTSIAVPIEEPNGDGDGQGEPETPADPAQKPQEPAPPAEGEQSAAAARRRSRAAAQGTRPEALAS